MQMVQLSATRCSCITIFVSQSSEFSATTLCVASQRVLIVVVVVVVVVYFVIDSDRKRLDPPSYIKSEVTPVAITRSPVRTFR
jgi:uncharacterized membrane protein AbrB (regulator of aidB expression)